MHTYYQQFIYPLQFLSTDGLFPSNTPNKHTLSGFFNTYENKQK